MSLCSSEDSALVIMDIQKGLTSVMPAKVLARLQRNTGMLLKAAALFEIPVFATEQYPEGLGEMEPDIQALLPGDARRYRKTAFSCAGADGFLQDLEQSGRRQVVLGGMEAHVCIMQSALDLCEAGMDVFIVADAVCSRHRENYETALQRLRHGGINVTDAESVLFEWLRDSTHSHFKAVHRLVK